jgi:hypothetical protein
MTTTLTTLGAVFFRWDSVMLPDTYLLIEECRSGTLELFALRDDTPFLDLEALVDAWIAETSCGELVRDGDMQHQLPGDYYATLQTDGRPLDSCVVWEAGGFYVKEAP